MSVPSMPLAGQVPVIHIDNVQEEMEREAGKIETQLTDWGFMAAEVPGIGDLTRELMEAFSNACDSDQPRLSDYVHTAVPQLSSGTNHGYFPFWSEVPRLAKGVADPKQFAHISGAMLSNKPPGSIDMLTSFPVLEQAARRVFNRSFEIISAFGRIVGGMLPDGCPDLDLSSDATNLRVIQYLVDDGREVLAHEHSGIQMLGLQLPPSDQGLQYILHDGTWVEPVIANTDIVLCNIGRMLTRASEKRFRPSTHRVHCATGSEYERSSAVLFAYPPLNQKQWVVSETGVRWSDETWGDFIQQRFAGLGKKSDEL